MAGAVFLFVLSVLIQLRLGKRTRAESEESAEEGS
jgi:hypothetical protein